LSFGFYGLSMSFIQHRPHRCVTCDLFVYRVQDWRVASLAVEEVEALWSPVERHIDVVWNSQITQPKTQVMYNLEYRVKSW